MFMTTSKLSIPIEVTARNGLDLIFLLRAKRGLLSGNSLHFGFVRTLFNVFWLWAYVGFLGVGLVLVVLVTFIQQILWMVCKTAAKWSQTHPICKSAREIHLPP